MIYPSRNGLGDKENREQSITSMRTPKLRFSQSQLPLGCVHSGLTGTLQDSVDSSSPCGWNEPVLGSRKLSCLPFLTNSILLLQLLHSGVGFIRYGPHIQWNPGLQSLSLPCTSKDKNKQKPNRRYRVAPQQRAWPRELSREGRAQPPRDITGP